MKPPTFVRKHARTMSRAFAPRTAGRGASFARRSIAVLALAACTSMGLTALALAADGGTKEPPPVPECYHTGSGYGLCEGYVIPKPGSIVLFTYPGKGGVFKLTGPAPLQTKHWVACGDAGCVYNHLDWAVFTKVVSGCKQNTSVCNVRVPPGSAWTPVYVRQNTEPALLYLLWNSGKEGGTISGYVLDENHKAVAAATVRAHGPHGDTSAATDWSGFYTMNVKAGQYGVVPSGGPSGEFSAYDPVKANVSVSAGGKGRADFTLLASPNGIDWQMPDRVKLGTDVSMDGGLPSAHYVYPDSWSAKLYLTEDGKRVMSCPSRSVWKWKVTAPETKGNGEPTITQPKDGCSTSFETTQLGTYKVTAQRYQETEEGLVKAGREVDTPPVVLKDLLIVGLGDSNGSGEGDPSFYFLQCHRGEASYQYQAAELLEQQFDGHTSVTFVSASCSGAKIENLTSLPYKGIEKYLGPVGNPLAPQVDAVKALIDDSGAQSHRKVAAAFVSIGINNIAFGPLMGYCIGNRRFTPCADQDVTPVYKNGFISGFEPASAGSGTMTLRQWIAQLTKALPSLYQTLQPALARIVAPQDTFITEYPTFAYANTEGDVCSGGIFSSATWNWMLSAGHALNAEVDATDSLDWQVVRVDPEYFLGHGYCARDSWFVRVTNAIDQLNADGAFHTTTTGAAVTAKLIASDSCPVIATKDECTKMPLADNPRAAAP